MELLKIFHFRKNTRLWIKFRRSVASVPTNIVEGNEHQGKKEFLQFLFIAKGSLIETRYHLLLAKDLGYLKLKEYKLLHDKSLEVAKMLNRLIKFLKTSS